MDNKYLDIYYFVIDYFIIVIVVVITMLLFIILHSRYLFLEALLSRSGSRSLLPIKTVPVLHPAIFSPQSNSFLQLL